MKFQSLGTGQPTVIVSLVSGYLYTANQTTESFLRAIDGEKTFGAIVSELLEVYDVSPKKLTLDLGKLVEQLLSENLLLLVGEGVTHA